MSEWKACENCYEYLIWCPIMEYYECSKCGIAHKEKDIDHNKCRAVLAERGQR